jgi:hypothetical protein
VGADTMFDPIDAPEMPQRDAEEWRPMLSPTGAKADDFRHPKLGEPSETWGYCNAAGLLEGYVCRFEIVLPDGTRTKEFRPLRYGVLSRNGRTRTGWHWKGWGENRPLYGLCELLARPDAKVIIVEGERKVDAAQRLFPEYVAVSPMNGANSPHQTDWTPVAERKVIFWPDHDEPGRSFARAGTRLTRDAGAALIAVVSVPREWPEHWDLADPPPDGVSPETLTAMLESAELRVSPRPGRSPSPTPKKRRASEEEITASVRRLAKLSYIKYQIEREDEAARLGIRVTALDRLVAGGTRTAGEDEVKPGQGRPVQIPEPEPWHEPVDGAQLLDELAAALQKYVILSDTQADAIALWIVRTHAHDAFDFNPPMWIKSVEKRSGKTRLCEVIERLAARPLLVSGLSPSALLRVIETHRPSIILDEFDALIGKGPELAEAVRGLINSSFERASARHILSVPVPGGGYEVRQFSMWAPLVVSGIGKLPDTVADRSVVIEMKRKRPDEKVARLRRRDGRDLDNLARKGARWTEDKQIALGDARPEMPPWLHDRASDGWEPLFAIAELAGESWKKRAESAAASLSGSEAAEDDSIRIKLLSDICDAFNEQKTDRLSSDDIVAYLVKLEGRPWPEFGKQRKPISKNQLADLLRALHILPRSIRLSDGRTPKGYYLSKFKDAFSRYVLSSSIQTATPTQAKGRVAFGENQTATSASLCRSENIENSNAFNVCGGVAGQNPKRGDTIGNAADSGDEDVPFDNREPATPYGSKRGRVIL